MFDINELVFIDSLIEDYIKFHFNRSNDMFGINELIFIDSLIEDYLKFHSELPLEVRNRILKLDNKVMEYIKAYKEARMVEFEEDKQQLKRIVK